MMNGRSARQFGLGSRFLFGCSACVSGHIGTQYIFRGLTLASVVRRVRSGEPVGLDDLDANRVIDGAG